MGCLQLVNQFLTPHPFKMASFLFSEEYGVGNCRYRIKPLFHNTFPQAEVLCPSLYDKAIADQETY